MAAAIDVLDVSGQQARSIAGEECGNVSDIIYVRQHVLVRPLTGALQQFVEAFNPGGGNLAFPTGWQFWRRLLPAALPRAHRMGR